MLMHALHSLPVVVLIGLACTLVVVGLMKGIIGVGMAIVGLPLLSMLIDVQAAVTLLAVPLILSNIPQALEGGRTLECFKRLVPVLLGMMPGVVVGVAILVLGASKEASGPGPLVSSLGAGSAAGKFPIPITVVPGELAIADIQALA